MINVIFFASLREQLGVGTAEIALADAPDIDALVNYLVQTNGDEWAEILRDDNNLVAVNQALVSDTTTRLKAGDEVAFLPPVTGG